MKTFDSGAKSSEAAPRYDLIPLASLQRQAARMALGAASHGERNYRKGVDDPVFIRDRVNHLLGHALAYAAGDTSDDHLGAVLANAGMLADLEAMRVPVSETYVPERDTPPAFDVLESRTVPSGNTPDTEYHPSRLCSCASCQSGSAGIFAADSSGER